MSEKQAINFGLQAADERCRQCEALGAGLETLDRILARMGEGPISEDDRHKLYHALAIVRFNAERDTELYKRVDAIISVLLVKAERIVGVRCRKCGELNHEAHEETRSFREKTIEK